MNLVKTIIIRNKNTGNVTLIDNDYDHKDLVTFHDSSNSEIYFILLQVHGMCEGNSGFVYPGVPYIKNDIEST
jgi:hypothetical protein